MAAAIEHPLLARCGVAHGFGVRGVSGPPEALRPRQVHGKIVAEPRESGVLEPEEADAVVSAQPGLPVAVVTADCVPILACSRDGSAVAAIHAGWRGLAEGVVEAGILALRSRARPGDDLVAVVGPHIGVCCYEVDAPVLSALGARFGVVLESAVRPTRPGHARLDLGRLVQVALRESGVEEAACASLEDVCTRCDAVRFHSYRRDGNHSGRLVHFVAACSPVSRPL